MVAIYHGWVPTDPSHPIDISDPEIYYPLAQQGFGPSPEEAQAIIDEAQRQRDIVAAADAEMIKRQELAEMEQKAQEASEFYYGTGGPGYGTEPGGADVVYYGDTVLYESEPGSLIPLGFEWPELPRLISDRALVAGGLVVAALLLK